jgi:hypothetical protein
VQQVNEGKGHRSVVPQKRAPADMTRHRPHVRTHPIAAATALVEDAPCRRSSNASCGFASTSQATRTPDGATPLE